MATARARRVPQRCTIGEFNEAVAYFRLEPQSVERVRQVLVEGEAPSVVAEREGIKQPQLHRQYSKVLRMVEKLREGRPQVEIVPEGWETATLVAPSEFLADTGRRLQEYLKKNADVGTAQPSTRM